MREWERLERIRKAKLEKAIEIFRDVACENYFGKYDRYLMLRGWHLYLDVHNFLNAEPWPFVPNIIKCLQGYPFDEQKVVLGHWLFRAETYQFGGKRCPGIVLESMDSNSTSRALNFCEEMDSVGWKAGDLSAKFPPK